MPLGRGKHGLRIDPVDACIPDLCCKACRGAQADVAHPGIPGIGNRAVSGYDSFIGLGYMGILVHPDNDGLDGLHDAGRVVGHIVL